MLATFKNIINRKTKSISQLHTCLNYTATNSKVRTAPQSVYANNKNEITFKMQHNEHNNNQQQHVQFANQIKQFSLNPNNTQPNTINNILNQIEIFNDHESSNNESYLTANQQKMIDKLTKSRRDTDAMDAFYMVDLGDIIRQHALWTNLLPSIHPFYAVKCNPDPLIISLLNYLGCSFDCASKTEFNLLHSAGIDITADKVIFSHPCKHPLHLQYARDIGVNLCTFDNEYELEKINTYHPNCGALLRIQVDDSQSICKFNSKYGLNVDEKSSIYDIFEACCKYEVNLCGVMFHVGSGCLDSNVYATAIEKSKYLFDIAHGRFGFDASAMNILDLGGGFPGDIVYQKNCIQFEEIASVINQSLQYYFGDGGEYKFIAEPGRYYVSKSHSLICDIIAKKRNDSGFMYYLNEGMYGSFNCMYFDHAEPVIIPYGDGKCDGKKYESRIFGPTCDSMDKMYDNYSLPEMHIMDKVIIPNFGAYTGAASSGFNGFEKSKSRYVMTL